MLESSVLLELDDLLFPLFPGLPSGGAQKKGRKKEGPDLGENLTQSYRGDPLRRTRR